MMVRRTVNEMEGSVEFENASIGFGRREWGGFVVETIDLRGLG